MNVVPRNIVEQIEFFESHVARWAEQAEEIGSTPEEIAEVAARTAEARQAFRDQQHAQNAARTATSRLKSAMAAMKKDGTSVILRARALARQEGVEVYAKASIRQPDQASPLGVPGKPTNFKAKLITAGGVLLKWTCDNPRGSKGTMYIISRSDTWPPDFKRIGMSGKKQFLDESIPRGAHSLIYQIQAVRSTRLGPIADFNVSLGGCADPRGPKEIQLAA